MESAPMNTSPRVFVILAVSASLLGASPSPKPASIAKADPLAQLAEAALRGNAPAIAKLRAAGPAALEALFTAAAPQITALRANKSRLEDAANAPLRAAIDGVARQRDAYASGLYWYTDIAAAKAEAKRTNRPILSLRLLGNLDDEYSCANSRFFRTSLYANRDVSSLLRHGYVLHWKSVRPVPILTIDMGDGRRIKRTITGNSIHYVLNQDGVVLDALPGNYAPAGFIAALERTERNTQNPDRAKIREWHGREADCLCIEWLGDAIRAGVYGDKARAAIKEDAAKTIAGLFPTAFPDSTGTYPAATIVRVKAVLDGPPLPTVPFQPDGQETLSLSRFGEELILPMAFDHRDTSSQRTRSDGMLSFVSVAGRMFPHIAAEAAARGDRLPLFQQFDPPKGMVERPLIRNMPAPAAEAALDTASPSANPQSPTLAQRMTNEAWAAIGGAYRTESWLDDASLRFMMAKLPESMLLPEEIKDASRYGNENSPFHRMLRTFEAAIARDMVRNEYYFHTLIHQWLEEDKDGTLTNDVEALNKRVYAELFLTPDYDEWLGLVPEDAYTALEKDGCACDKGAPPMNTTKKAAPH